MKKTIIIAGLALVAFTNVAVATNFSTNSYCAKEFSIVTNTPLCSAIIKGDLATVKKFIEYGADIEEKSNGLTPLMFAARFNKVDIIKYLLENGANKSTKDERGYTAIQFAEFSKSQEAVALLK
jgi:ankyrin repeat protein